MASDGYVLLRHEKDRRHPPFTLNRRETRQNQRYEDGDGKGGGGPHLFLPLPSADMLVLLRKYTTGAYNGDVYLFVPSFNLYVFL